MADLKVDYDLLTDSSASLGHIYSCFDHLETQNRTADDDWGSADIRSAMGSFAGNWDHHRQQTMKSIDSVKQAVDGALKGFRDTDRKLARSLAAQPRSSVVGGAPGRAV